MGKKKNFKEIRKLMEKKRQAALRMPDLKKDKKRTNSDDLKASKKKEAYGDYTREKGKSRNKKDDRSFARDRSGNRVRGIYEANSRGFGFVRVETSENGAEQADIYISESNSCGAMHRDTVEVVLLTAKNDPKPEGKIVKIVDHEYEKIVGVYKKNKEFGFVIPDDPKLLRDIFVLPKNDHHAESYDKVIVKITTYGDLKHKPEGQIIKVLGNKNAPGVDMLSVALAHGVPERFPFNIREEAKQIPDEVLLSEKEGRRDLRDLFTVTIDNDDSKDLDDAISVEREGQNYLLGVHIADVSHYVRENTKLDEEAYKRSTSVYLPGTVFPMLPENLSNSICTLNQGVDRLAMSLFMKIDPKGNILSSDLCESVICVNHRLSYSGVDRDLQNGEAESEELYRLECDAKTLAGILREKRVVRGAIGFEFPESQILFDEKGRVSEIRAYERKEAARIIEDFMLAANETIADLAFNKKLPFIYRVHETMDEVRTERLRVLLGAFGYTIHLSQGAVDPKEVAEILEKLEGTEEEAFLSRMILRSMSKAVYSDVPGSHFGLAASLYTHFTSPIRRYPDLLIHRILKEDLHGKLNEQRRAHYETYLPEAAKHTSTQERSADETERDAVKLKKAVYMKRFIGEVFEGTVSGLTRYGVYVELDNTVEGMISLSSLGDDHYLFLEDEYQMVGQMRGRVIRMGDRIPVIVSSVDEDAKTIDFRPYRF